MADVPDTHDFLPGLATSSEMNSFVRDPVRFLLNKPAANVRQTTAQTGIVTAVFTSVTFTTEDLDSDPDAVGGHDTGTNTSRFVAQYPGWYRVAGAVAWANNATGQRGTRWAVNGTALNASAILLATISGNVTVVPARTMLVSLGAFHYVELQGYQTSGGNLDMFVSAEYSSSMSVEWVRNL